MQYATQRRLSKIQLTTKLDYLWFENWIDIFKAVLGAIRRVTKKKRAESRTDFLMIRVSVIEVSVDEKKLKKQRD